MKNVILSTVLAVGFSMAAMADIPTIAPKVKCKLVKLDSKGLPDSTEVKAFLDSLAERRIQTQSVSVSTVAGNKALVCATTQGGPEDEE